MEKIKTLAKHKKERGFIALIAMIVVSTVLALSIGILDITLRDLIISNIERESLKALYAANAGIDCALHYDVVKADTDVSGNFASPLFADSKQPGNSVPNDITCVGTGIETGPLVGADCFDGVPANKTKIGYCVDTYDNPYGTMEIHTTNLGEFDLPDPVNPGDGTCARAQVIKTQVTPSKEVIVIKAWGNNRPCGSASSKKVERALLIRLLPIGYTPP